MAGPAAGAAFYQQAELHRLRGEFAGPRRPTARPASGDGSRSLGLALLRLAQEQVEAAAAAIRRVMERGI